MRTATPCCGAARAVGGFVALVALVAVLVSLALAYAVVPAAHAAPTAPSSRTTTGATPSPPPAPRNVVRPWESVGGAQLASMGVVVDLPPGVPAPPAPRDGAWLVADADTGAVLAAKAAHGHYLPASTVKALTALVLLPRLDPRAVHVATEAEVAADGTRVGLLPGQPYTARQLFQALLMASANDAAYALTDLAGGRARTLEAVNARARELGALDTVVRDPSGLDAPGQRTSVYDLALIGRAAVKDPTFVSYATTRQARFPGKPGARGKTGAPGKRATYVIGNHNQLLWNYPGTIGVKNGYTQAANRTFVGAARRHGKTYLVAELASQERGWRAPAALLDWAFAHGDTVTPVGRLVEPGEVRTPPSPSPTPGTRAVASASPDARGAVVVATRPLTTPRPHAPVAAATLSMGPWVGAATLLVIAATLVALARSARLRRRGDPG